MLNVWFDVHKVGVLRAEKRVLSFTYDQHWLNAADAFPLSPRIPLTDAPSTGDEPLFFFSNLLPEGALLRALCKLKRLPEGDTFAQLKAFGSDAAGAFSLLPEEEVPSRARWSYKPYSDMDLIKDLEQMKSGLKPIYAQHEELRLSLAGAQDKLPVHYENGQLFLPLNGAPSTYILKPALQPEAQFPHSVANEALCVMLAQASLSERGDQIAEEIKIKKIHDQEVLLIRRFDRREEMGRWHRVHQLDFCQLSGVLPDQKYEKDGGPGFAQLFRIIAEHSALPAIDRLHALDWVLFNFLIGNADAHAKNLAMMPAGGQLYSLAPLYDLLCTQLYPHLTTKLAMKVGGEDRPMWVRAKNWAAFADEVGVNKSLLRKRATTIADNALSNLDRVSESISLDAIHPLVVRLRDTIERGSRIAARSADAP